MQEEPKKIIKVIAKDWPGDAAADLRTFAKLVGFLGSRHAHVGAADTLDYLDVAGGKLQAALGPHPKDPHWAPAR
jgi:hypothetical protein